MIFFATTILIFLFVFYLVNSVDFTHLTRSVAYLFTALVILTIISITYIIALYISKVDRYFKLKLEKLRDKEILTINIGLLFLSLILGIYIGVLYVLLRVLL